DRSPAFMIAILMVSATASACPPVWERVSQVYPSDRISAPADAQFSVMVASQEEPDWLQVELYDFANAGVGFTMEIRPIDGHHQYLVIVKPDRPMLPGGHLLHAGHPEWEDTWMVGTIQVDDTLSPPPTAVFIEDVEFDEPIPPNICDAEEKVSMNLILSPVTLQTGERVSVYLTDEDGAPISDFPGFFFIDSAPWSTTSIWQSAPADRKAPCYQILVESYAGEQAWSNVACATPLPPDSEPTSTTARFGCTAAPLPARGLLVLFSVTGALTYRSRRRGGAHCCC
ncbi:MAG: hypothetical protein AAFV53_43805, partial [Myxococcota bacterium]